MAKAYRCDLCNKFTDYAYKVDGLDFKIGERRDEFTGTCDKRQEVHEVYQDCYDKIMKTVVCQDCYDKIMKKVESLYSRKN